MRITRRSHHGTAAPSRALTRMRIAVTGWVLAAVLGGSLVGLAAASTQLDAKGRICGQIKHGPSFSWPFPLNGKTLKGTTWSVFTDPGADCGAAMKLTSKLLKQWPKVKPGKADLAAGPAWRCQRIFTQGTPVGTGECWNVSKKPFPLGPHFEFWMTGNLTVAQLKSYVVFGR